MKDDMNSQKSTSRSNDPERTKEDIIRIATQAFAKDGFNGSRVDEIAELTHTSKRMIYYYFESKEGLYREVLKRCYERIKRYEEDLDLTTINPEDALARMIRFTFDYHLENTDFVRLVMVENIHQAQYLKTIPEVKERAASVISVLKKIIDKGIETGVFRNDIDPLNLHMTISALCFYNVSNRGTFAHVFDHDMSEYANAVKRRDVVVDFILSGCRRK